MSAQTRFTLEDINKIKMKGFDAELPKQSIDLINQLAKLVGSPEYVRTPVFKKHREDFSERGSHQHHQTQTITDADWEALRNYKVTTTVPADRTATEQQKRDIITALRKMTESNYTAQSEYILTNLDNIPVEDFETLANELFTICSGNKFYVNVYTDLYNALQEKYKIFDKILRETHDNYLKQFLNIEIVDPEKNYNRFCEINKENELRVALSVFLMNILSKDAAETLVLRMLTEMYTQFSKENNISVVEQYVENVTEMIKSCHGKHGDFASDNIIASIQNIAVMQPKTVPSINNKIIFKFMDLEDTFCNED